MDIWIPFVSSRSAVINFNEPRAWDKIENALIRPSNVDWTPLEAFVAKGEPDGFVYAGGVLICDGSTWQILGDKLKNEVEPLAIAVNSEPYYILHIVSILPCLDENESRLIRSPFDGNVVEVIHHCFNASFLKNVFLFRVPEKPREVFATSLFKDLVEDNKIRNLDFQRFSYSLNNSGDTIQ